MAKKSPAKKPAKKGGRLTIQPVGGPWPLKKTTPKPKPKPKKRSP